MPPPHPPFHLLPLSPPRPPPPPPPNKVLYVGSLLSDTNSAGLNKYFSEVYNLLDSQPGLIRVKILLNHNQTEAYALAYYETVENATAAMKDLKNAKTPGTQRPLQVTYATSPKTSLTTELPGVAQNLAGNRPSNTRSQTSRRGGPQSDISLPEWTPNTRGPGLLGDRPLSVIAPPEQTPNVRGPGLLGDREFVPGNYNITGDRPLAHSATTLGDSKYAPVMHEMPGFSSGPVDDKKVIEFKRKKPEQEEELKKKELWENELRQKEQELKKNELRQEELRQKEKEFMQKELRQKELRQKELRQKDEELKQEELKGKELRQKELKEKELRVKRNESKKLQELIKEKQNDALLNKQILESLGKSESKKELGEATRKEGGLLKTELTTNSIQGLREKELKQNPLQEELKKKHQVLIDKKCAALVIAGEKAANEVDAGRKTRKEINEMVLREKPAYEERKQKPKAKYQAEGPVLEQEGLMKRIGDIERIQGNIRHELSGNISLTDRLMLLSAKGPKQMTVEKNPHVQEEIQVKEITNIAITPNTSTSNFMRPATTLTDGETGKMLEISMGMEEFGITEEEWDDAF
ncbi:uncharacterized protein H6S33_000165 [Morchella sextelata]|uniref:uncharacterized protein n=1 Tax=Morchella sextelata TaxID=1174677 RepID=UPI001D038BBE|nr:uncharacterized protein H6S33_000165 [Morchella sextelata]KAH0614529.1 hypothetical protein H6S33_000165 [Morchella sextelata]